MSLNNNETTVTQTIEPLSDVTNRSFSKASWLLIGLPLLLWALVHFSVPEPSLFDVMNHQAQALPDVFWGFFVFLGNGWGLYSLVFPLTLFAPRLLAAGALSGLIAGLLSRSLKLWFDHPRPASVLDPSTFHIVGNPLLHLSFPSGHTLTAFSVATAFYFAATTNKRKPLWILFLIATGTAVARVAVGAHWPADVFAGAAIGIFSGLVGASVCNKASDRSFNRRSWVHWVFMIGAILDAYLLSTTVLDFDTNHGYQALGLTVIAITLLSLASKIIREQYPPSK